MTTLTKPSPQAPRARSEANLKFANDGSFESVQRMLHATALRCFGRAQKLGISMDFSDVSQEMNESYVRAKAKWNPQGGALFSTYCQTVCVNNFNAAIKKMERERTQLGMVSSNVMSGEDGETSDMAEMMPASPTDSPDYRIEKAQELSRKFACLSLSAKKLISLMLRNEQDANVATPTLRQAAKMIQVEGTELRRLKLEILNTYGVTWH